MQQPIIVCPETNSYFVEDERIQKIAMVLILYRDRPKKRFDDPCTYANAEAQNFLRKSLSKFWQQLHTFDKDADRLQATSGQALTLTKQKYHHYSELLLSREAIDSDSLDAYLPIEAEIRTLLSQLRQIQSESRTLVTAVNFFVENVLRYLEGYDILTRHLDNQSKIKACSARCKKLLAQCKTLQSHPIQKPDFFDNNDSIDHILTYEMIEKENQRKFECEHFQPAPYGFTWW